MEKLIAAVADPGRSLLLGPCRSPPTFAVRVIPRSLVEDIVGDGGKSTGAAVGGSVGPGMVATELAGVVFAGVRTVFCISADGGSKTPNQSAVHMLLPHAPWRYDKIVAGIDSCGVQRSEWVIPAASTLQFAVQVH